MSKDDSPTFSVVEVLYQTPASSVSTILPRAEMLSAATTPPLVTLVPANVWQGELMSESSSVQLDDNLQKTAHASMSPWKLTFKSARIETLYRQQIVRQRIGMMRLSVPFAIPMLVPVTMEILAVGASSGAPSSLATSLVSWIAVGLTALLSLVVCLTPRPFMEKYWNIVTMLSVNLYIVPLFLVLVACVADGIAPNLYGCTPNFLDLEPLLPLMFAIVSPHLNAPLTGCSWYIPTFLSIEFAAVTPLCAWAAGAKLPLILFIFALMGTNVFIVAGVSYNMERSIRTGLWMNIVNQNGASALEQTEAQFKGATVRNNAFNLFAMASGQVLFELDAQYTVGAVSGACQDLLQASAAQVIGRPYSDGIHSDDGNKVRDALIALRKSSIFGAKPLVMEYRRLRPDKSCIWIQLVAVIEDGVLLASERDISSEREAREAVALERQRRVAATAAQAAHDETLGYACHELRNPLHVIQATLAFLKETELCPEQTEHVMTIDTAASQMHTLVDDILDVDRLRAGKLVLRTAPCHPAALVQKAATQHKDFARVPVSFEVAPSVPDVVVMAGDRVTQILNNGMTNAAKFTSKGVIRVRVLPGATRNSLRFEVRNSGTLPNRPLFAAFESDPGAAAVTRAVKGTGLGLRISASLAMALGGELNLENQPVLAPMADVQDATETVFWFQIPFSSATESDTMPTMAEQEEKRRRSVNQPLGLHVLYVDDEPMNRRIGQAMLHKLGCTCVVIEDGDQVMSSVPETFDVILMDIVMQRMHGDDAIKQLIAAGIRTPCFAVSGNTDQASVQNYLRIGFREVLGKPFTADQVHRMLLPYSREQHQLPGLM